MSMENHTFYQNFGSLAVALAIGLLVGLERGWTQREETEGLRVAGLRTFALIGLLGGIVAILAQQLESPLFGFAFLALAATLLAAHLVSSPRKESYGVTSEIASLVTFSLGAVAAAGEPAIAAASAVVVTLLLGLKEEMHGWLERIDRQELMAAVQLLLISVVVIPLLPNRQVGPWKAINPYELWWLVVLIASISFVGHFAMRIAGQRRGIVITGIFGGLASSTALTVNFARLGRRNTEAHGLLAVSLIIAAGTTFPRMAIELAIVNRQLLLLAGPSLAAMTALSYVIAGLAWLKVRRERLSEKLDTGPPFQLSFALTFGLLLAAIVVLSEAARHLYGAGGVYALAVLSGLANVDAITLTVGRMGNGGLSLAAAGWAVILAGAANTLFKALLVVSLVRGRLALWMIATMAAVAGAGLATMMLRAVLRG